MLAHQRGNRTSLCAGGSPLLSMETTLLNHTADAAGLPVFLSFFFFFFSLSMGYLRFDRLVS